jgi:hypothetical protein
MVCPMFCTGEIVSVAQRVIDMTRRSRRREIPAVLRDFQAQWKSPALGLFHCAAPSTALFARKYSYRARFFSRDITLVVRGATKESKNTVNLRLYLTQ